MNLRLEALTCAVLLVLALTFQAYAQEPYVVQEASVIVYRDGVACVKVGAAVDPTEPSITLTLLSNSPYNILALDERNETLSYDISGWSITVYTTGASKLTLEYDADTLTSKSAGVWTVSFTTTYQLSLILPEGATILYFSAPPTSIENAEGKLALVLSPGTWEISYTLEVLAPLPPSPQPSPQPAPQPPSQPFPLQLVLAILCVAAVAIAALVLFRRRRMLEILKREEAEVIRFLKERGGRVLEAELREAFPNIPKTSMWRLVKRLEKRGIVTVKKVGMQNVVQLKSMF
jgi:uncharacterized membrane protein